MVIFIAVMLTDIILLDFFNTIGLPTSTTVSIVFELLGAAVVVALIKVFSNGEGLAALSQYINSEKAVKIISGIFLSVVVAFAVGVLVMFISRLIFSYRYKEGKRIISSIWAGSAMTAMSYFLLFKGVKGASFATPEFVSWVKTEIFFLLTVFFIGWTVLMHILSYRKVDIFKGIVLFGTFSLAMAFAGNDLVNFIGVPIAGFESFLAWSQSGIGAFDYSMGVLQEPVQTKSYLLALAGIIMVTTLWFSRKARSVTETEVNLSRQDEGYERFAPTPLARGVVGHVISMFRLTQKILPAKLINLAQRRFKPAESTEERQPAFDMVRAGVNLTTASILIAFATSLKLPLSTTYVSFMVAMGTSLADRAWGRDSAVYRVAGVFNVIGGWFATALIAFTISGIFALAVYYFQISAVSVLIIVALIFIYRSFSFHRSEEIKKKQKRLNQAKSEQLAITEIYTQMAGRTADLFNYVKEAYAKMVYGLVEEDIEALKGAKKTVDELKERNDELQYRLYKSIKNLGHESAEGSKVYLQAFSLEQDMVQSTQLIVSSAKQHVKNVLSPLKPSQIASLTRIQEELDEYFSHIQQYILSDQRTEGSLLAECRRRLSINLEEALTDQVDGIRLGIFGSKNSQLFFKLLLKTKGLVATATDFAHLKTRMPKKSTKQQEEGHGELALVD